MGETILTDLKILSEKLINADAREVYKSGVHEYRAAASTFS